MSKAVDVLFSELSDLIQKGEIQHALKVCDQILKQSPNDEDALTCKIVALIQLNKIADALAVLEKNKLQQCQYEHAYCLYREQRFQEALKVLKSCDDEDGHRVKELEAQIRYGLEEYSASAGLYGDILAEGDEASSELKTNLCAALNLAGDYKKAESLISQNQDTLHDTFEFAYNAACCSVAVDDHSSAFERLDLAEKLCRETLQEDDCTEEEIQDELAPVLAQGAYLMQLENKVDKATEIYNTIIQQKPSDISVLAVANNNLVAIQKDMHFFDLEKKLRKASSDEVQKKLTFEQRRIIAFNHCLISFYMHKEQQCRREVQELQEKYPESPMPALILASLLLHKQKISKCEELLRSEIERQTSEDVQTKLSLAQVYLSQKNFEGTIEVLSTIDSIRHKPGMVSTLVSLYKQANDVPAAVKLLDESVAYWESKASQGKKETREYKEVVSGAADFKLKHKLYHDAILHFSLLLKLDRSDLDALTGLIVACSEVDIQQAEKHISGLPKLKLQTVDAEALENLVIKATEKEDVVPMSNETVVKRKRKTKKKKKPRYPKDYDPAAGVVPDPERWLPRRDRSYYKRRGKKDRIGRGAQGSAKNSQSKNLQHERSDKGKSNEDTTQHKSKQKRGSSTGRRKTGRRKGRR